MEINLIQRMESQAKFQIAFLCSITYSTKAGIDISQEAKKVQSQNGVEILHWNHIKFQKS